MFLQKQTGIHCNCSRIDILFCRRYHYILPCGLYRSRTRRIAEREDHCTVGIMPFVLGGKLPVSGISGASRPMGHLNLRHRRDSHDALGRSCCGTRNSLLAYAHRISTAATPFYSLYPPPAALANVPLCVQVLEEQRRVLHQLLLCAEPTRRRGEDFPTGCS